MPDDGIGVVLVLVEEIVGPREGYLVDVLVDFFGSHAYAAVAYGERALVDIQAHPYGEVAQLALVVALGCQRLELLRGVYGIRNYFTKEYLVVAVKKLFDDGENVFGCNPDGAFCHIALFFFDSLFENLQANIVPFRCLHAKFLKKYAAW